MAAIVSTDVAYVPLGIPASGTTGPYGAAEVASPGRIRRQFKLTFPATNQDYPAGGVPLNGLKMGCRVVTSLKVMGQTPIAGDSNYMWGWNGDPLAPKLVAFQGGSVGTAPFRETAVTGLTVNSQILFVDVEGWGPGGTP